MIKIDRGVPKNFGSLRSPPRTPLTKNLKPLLIGRQEVVCDWFIYEKGKIKGENGGDGDFIFNPCKLLITIRFLYYWHSSDNTLYLFCKICNSWPGEHSLFLKYFF